MTIRSIGKTMAAGCLVIAAFAVLPGCERKEKILDIETPSGEVEVERNLDTGAVDVEVSGENRQP